MTGARIAVVRVSGTKKLPRAPALARDPLEFARGTRLATEFGEMTSGSLRSALVLVALVHAGCVSQPDEASRLTLEAPLEALSENGLVHARLELAGAELHTGDNDFLLVLDAVREDERVSLDRVVASMPAHGHSAEPGSIEGAASGFRIEALPFSMPGLWQLACDVSVGSHADLVAFSVDVP
jgi:hypothetical protein